MPSPVAPRPPVLPAGMPDFNAIRVAFVHSIQDALGIAQGQVVEAEPETQDFPRPELPYFSMKVLVPAFKYGDDDERPVLDANGKPTTTWNSGGPRKMTAEFNCYGNSHEEAYNLMSWWQTALDTKSVQAQLRAAGISVWTIGAVADISKLLNTGYEGRAHLECTFGLAMNLTQDLGEEGSVTVVGTVTTDQGNQVTTTVTAKVD